MNMISEMRKTGFILFLMVLLVPVLLVPTLQEISVQASAQNSFLAVNVQTGGGQGFTLQDAQVIRSMGFDTVRLTIKWTRRDLNAYDRMVQAAEQAGLKVIVCMAWDGYGNVDISKVRLNSFYENLFANGASDYAQAWAMIADKYKNDPSILYFELINEPSISDLTRYPTIYKDFIETTIDAIRATGAQQSIAVPILMDNNWIEVLSPQPDIDRTNVAWVTHTYSPWGDFNPQDRYSGTQSIINRLTRIANWVKSKGKPWINTEFGKQTNKANWQTWLDLVLKTMTNLGIQGWTFHAYDRADPNGFSIVDSNRNVRQSALNTLEPYMARASMDPNLLWNSSVEEGDANGPYNWTSGKDSDVTGEAIWSSTAAHTGSKSLGVNIEPDSGVPQEHTIGWLQQYNLDDPSSPFQRNSTCKFRTWYMTSGCQMRIWGGMWDVNGKWISGTMDTLRSVSWVQSDWTTLTIAGNAQYVAFGIQVQSRDIDSGVLHASASADDFEVVYSSLS